MRFILGVVLSLISYNNCFAKFIKNKFFLDFGICNKINYLSKYELHTPLINPYCIVEQLQFPSIPSVFINFGAGYVFNNRDELLLRLIQDQASVGHIASYNNVITFEPTPLIGVGQSKGIGGGVYTCLGVEYRKLLNRNSIKPKVLVHYTIGMYYLYKQNKEIFSASGPDGISFTAQDSNHVNITFTTYSVPTDFIHSFKLNAGLTFSVFRGENELFSISVSFITGRLNSIRSIHGMTKIEVSVYDKSNRINLYNHATTFISNGNGILFSLNKKIFPYKIVEKRKSKNKMIGS